ncbi:MAG: hypothetical protein KDD43_16610 [Bdellovibrionales bacterium]|nr:hypothetical protein [Bdellovibrionales bacterium]
MRIIGVGETVVNEELSNWAGYRLRQIFSLKRGPHHHCQKKVCRIFGRSAQYSMCSIPASLRSGAGEKFPRFNCKRWQDCTSTKTSCVRMPEVVVVVCQSVGR